MRIDVLIVLCYCTISLLLILFIGNRIKPSKGEENLHYLPFSVDGNHILLYNGVARIIWGSRCLLTVFRNNKSVTLNSLLQEISYDGSDIVFAIIEQPGNGKIYQYDQRGVWYLHGITAGIS